MAEPPGPAITPGGTGGDADLLRWATRASLALAVTLIALKAGAWSLTGSVSMLASLVDSAMDACASLMNLFAVRYALTPADQRHRFGHGKAESISALIQALLIILSAVFLVGEALGRLIEPEPLKSVTAGVAVTLFALVATVALVTFQRFVVARTGSTAIRADALHYSVDLATNGAILIALAMTGLGFTRVDSLLALGIAGYILWATRALLYDALNELLDRELPDTTRDRIEALARSHESVRGVHDLRTRSAGRVDFIELHIELDGDLRLSRAHRIADQVETMIREAIPSADVVIHMDPFGLEEYRLDEQLG